MHYFRRKPKPLDFTMPARIGKIVSSLILLYFTLVCIDYFLATTYNELQIESYERTTYETRGRRGGPTYHEFDIQTDKVNFFVRTNDNSILPGDTLKCEITPIFKEVISCHNSIEGNWHNMKPHHIYSPMFILFVVSLLFAALPFIVSSKEYQMLFSIAALVVFIMSLYMQKKI